MVGKEESIWRLARLIATMSNSARFKAFHLTDVEDVFVYYSYKEAKKLYDAYREDLRKEGVFV